MMIFKIFPCIYFVVSRIISIFALSFERYDRIQDEIFNRWGLSSVG